MAISRITTDGKDTGSRDFVIEPTKYDMSVRVRTMALISSCPDILQTVALRTK